MNGDYRRCYYLHKIVRKVLSNKIIFSQRLEGVSSSTCKELGSGNTVLTTGKKLNRLKNHQLFLDP